MTKRKLYPEISKKGQKNKYFDYLNFIQYSDGNNTLKKICELIKINNKKGKKIYNKLKFHKIVN